MNLHTVIMKIWARVKEGEVSSPFQRGGYFFLRSVGADFGLEEGGESLATLSTCGYMLNDCFGIYLQELY